MTTFDSTKRSLPDLLKDVTNGKIQLPDFQRGWVRDDDHVKSLLVSIARSFPVRPIVLSLLFTSTSVAAQADLPTTRQASIDASQAFGFLYSQQHTLDHIRSHYPDLANPVKAAEAAFMLTYSGARKYLKAALTQVAGKEGVQKLTNRLANEMEDVAERQAETRAGALAFIQEVTKRAKDPRLVSSPIRELLLTATYAEHPAQEMLDGHRTLYSTSGHPKAIGLDLSLNLPLSWRADEGRRPHIVQKWRSQGGHGSAEFMLLIMGLGMSATPDELEHLVATEDFSLWVPTGGRHLNTSRRRIDNQPAVAIDYEFTQDYGTTEVLIRMRQYNLFVDDKLIAFQCQSRAGTGDSPAAFDSLAAASEHANTIFTHYENTCEIAANSIVIDQLWHSP